MEDNSGAPSQNIYNDMKINLPNATPVLVLGIASIVTCFCYGVLGIICGIIALVLAGKDLRLYNAEPSRYTPSSYGNLKAGRICAIIGLIISALYLIAIIVIIATLGIDGLTHHTWMNHYN